MEDQCKFEFSPVQSDELRGPEDQRESENVTDQDDSNRKRSSSLATNAVHKKTRYSKKDYEISKRAFRAKSLNFKFEQDLEHALSSESYTEEEKRKVREYLEEKRKGRKEPHYLRTNITLDAHFPDEHDYRHCNEYREKSTIQFAMPSNRVGQGQTPTSAPRLSLFGALYLDLNSSAHDVQETAKCWFTMHRNAVYCRSKSFKGPEPDEQLAEKERQFYKEQYGDDSMDQFAGVDRNRIQTPVLHVTTREELEDPNLKRILNSASISVVSGICKAAAIDIGLFDVDLLKTVDPDMKVDCLFQNPQSADDNFDCYGIKAWRTSGVREEKGIEWFADYMRTREEQCHQYLKAMIESSDMKATEHKLLISMCAEQEDLPKEINKTMYWSAFGTNIDLQSREKFPEQHRMIDLLPEFLRPKFPGNLLNLIGEDVLGINTVQMYVKPPGARTAAHMENSLMASININLGPGTCVWFAIPYEYWQRLEDLVKSRELAYHGQNYWPDEEELRAAGIPVQKFEQRADELVYVNTGCFHWVQSSGYAVNISWNVGQPTAMQLSTSLIAATHNSLSGYTHHVPVIGIAWNIARQKLFLDDEQVYKVVRSILIRTLAHATWYQDELRIHDKWVIPKDELGFPLPPVIRCVECGAEVWNVVKLFTGSDVYETTCFCQKCQPSAENTKGRHEGYTVVTPLEELKQIMDGYKRQI